MTKATPSAHPALVTLALAMGAFAIGTTEFAAMSLLPFFAADLHIDEPAAGHAISAYALGVVVGAPVIAVLAARIARLTLLIGLMALFAVGNALSAIAPSYHALLVFRFITGLPHGAYFGVAALVAAALVPDNKRALSVARVMTGLTVATIIGVPMANWLGQAFGWRTGFGLVAGLAAVTMVLVALYAPLGEPSRDASPLRELGALRRPQVLLTLLTGAIGFGGFFAVYTYIASTLISVTHVSERWVPVVLAVFGVGMTIGNLVAGWAAGYSINRTAIAIMLWTTAALAFFTTSTDSLWTVTLAVFLIGLGGGLGAVLQTRLMDVAGDAQALAAAAHHSAFNVANALGPWLGGLAVSAGYGFASTGWIGVALSLGGLAVFLLALALERRSSKMAARIA
ncbi:MFS transporter [Novosphingobium sp. 9U]|uniref:MFS transporter n=1 Tax=Novosphingobium sp. 9U TaxID=2653158 RepID=UPI0012F29DB0|nr:MFS transporter [Novosphingobium sp. 9U]VWX54857.1 Inner membrane transport protein YdhP [Novosphingobium sp. 9U]